MGIPTEAKIAIGAVLVVGGLGYAAIFGKAPLPRTELKIDRDGDMYRATMPVKQSDAPIYVGGAAAFAGIAFLYSSKK
jgi:hypothetical protein